MLIKPVDNTNCSQADQDDNLFLMRRRLLKGMLIALVALGLPAVVISCIEAIKLGQLVGVMLYGGIYLIVSAITLYFNRLPFVLCAGVMLASLYMIAVFNFLHFSFSGAGIEIAITISVLATVLLGIRSGLITAAICLFTLITIGLCFVYGAIDVSPEMPATTTKAISWVTASAVFTFLTGSLILSSGKLQEYLIRSLDSLRYTTDELKESNKDLTREIKQREMAEAKLKQSEEQFRTLFETAPDAIYLTELDGTLLDGNRTAEELLGSPRELFIGKNFIDTGLLPKTEISKALTLMEKSSKGESTGPDELALLTSSGKATTVEILTSPFQLEDRPVILGIARDVSERKRLENHLNQSQKMESVGTLAGGIAHDFNNILSSIIGFTELALGGVDEGSDVEDDLQEVRKAGLRAKDLVKQILTFARQSDETVKPIQVNIIAKEVLKFITSSIPTSIQINNKIYSDSLIMGSSTQIHQILMNLCTNAAQAMEEKGGILEVSVNDTTIDKMSIIPNLRSGEYIEIKVTDTGMGISPQNIHTIFEPYFTTKPVGEGTGMGLAVVHGIVENYDGKITVDSTIDKGTCFTIYLPITKKRKVHTHSEKEELPLGNESILFVDDEAPIAKMGSKVLEQLGYTVTTRTSSVEALELFRSKPQTFDLVISDMTMPNMTGDKLAGELMKIRSDIPVVLCTGYSKKISEESAAGIGIKALVYKPVVKADLAKTVRKVLDEANSSE